MPTSILTVGPLRVSTETPRLTASGISHIFDNIPTSGLVLWLDATKIIGISSGASLSVWTDSSASGINFIQASATSKPRYVTNVKNGNAVVRFPSATTLFMDAASIHNIPQPYTIISITSLLAKGANNVIFSSTVGATEIDVYTDASGNINTFAGTNVNGITSISSGWHVVTSLFSGATSTIRIDGSQVTSGSLTATKSLLTGRLGNNSGPNSPCNGDIGEILIYRKELSTVELAQIESYATTKWGI